MAKKKSKKSAKGRISKKRMLVYIVLVILLALVLSFATLLVLLGMLPTFVARYVDQGADKNHSRVIGACNLAGVLPYLSDVIKKGITSDLVYDMLFNPQVWLVMYGAAAFGWALVWLFPKAVHFLLEIVQGNSVSMLKAKQQQIVDEWGSEVEKTSRRALRNATFKEEQKQKSQLEGGQE